MEDIIRMARIVVEQARPASDGSDNVIVSEQDIDNLRFYLEQ